MGVVPEGETPLHGVLTSDEHPGALTQSDTSWRSRMTATVALTCG